MAKVDFRWNPSPAVMVDGLERYKEDLQNAVKVTAEFLAEKMESDAKSNAPWEDQTGDARAGLTAEVIVDVAVRIVEIHLYHTVDYGVYLELNHGGKYAIILPTIHKYKAEIQRELQAIFGR